MMYWAVSELKIDYKKVLWETPLPLLMLCVRENQRQLNKNGMTLQDKEMIDKMIQQEKRDGK